MKAMVMRGVDGWASEGAPEKVVETTAMLQTGDGGFYVFLWVSLGGGRRW